VRLRFTLTDDAETRRLWPNPFHLELTIDISASLRVSLRMTNSGDTPITITGALHTYLRVGDIHQTKVQGLDKVNYLDTVGPHAERQQIGDIIFDREIDRAYDTANAITVRDDALPRDLLITGSGSKSAIVWNPWIAKSKTLTDLPDEDYQRFLCVETANAHEDFVSIPAQGTHTLTTTISINVH
jgi:glucose-6-phosphate 1-epimerase